MDKYYAYPDDVLSTDVQQCQQTKYPYRRCRPSIGQHQPRNCITIPYIVHYLYKPTELHTGNITDINM